MLSGKFDLLLASILALQGLWFALYQPKIITRLVAEKKIASDYGAQKTKTMKRVGWFIVGCASVIAAAHFFEAFDNV